MRWSSILSSYIIFLGVSFLVDCFETFGEEILKTPKQNKPFIYSDLDDLGIDVSSSKHFSFGF